MGVESVIKKYVAGRLQGVGVSKACYVVWISTRTSRLNAHKASLSVREIGQKPPFRQGKRKESIGGKSEPDGGG